MQPARHRRREPLPYRLGKLPQPGRGQRRVRPVEPGREDRAERRDAE
ncbi:hypothetical protein ACFUJR_05570 [Streptomyces sp. NPDC057271]